MSTGKRLKIARQHLGLKQADFSRELGMNQTNVSALERGNRTVTFRTAEILQSKFGINPDYLAGLSEVIFSKEPSNEDKYRWSTKKPIDISNKVSKAKISTDTDLAMKYYQMGFNDGFQKGKEVDNGA